MHAVLAVDVGIEPVAEEIQLGGGDIRVIVARIINIALGLLGIIALIFVLYGGFLWMTAGGDEEKVGNAKKVLTNAVIGLAIILTSFAISQFVLNSLLRATGVEEGAGPTGPGGGGIPGGVTRTFQVESMSPQGAVPIRNVAIRILFNAAVDAGTIERNITVARAADGTRVEGAFSAAGNKVIFVPDAACPDPNQSKKCFDADTEYRVSIATGLRSSGGMYVSCSGFGAICEGSFSTGNLVDVTGPNVVLNYPDNGQGIPVNSIITFQAEATDDAGVSVVDFDVDGALWSSDGPPSPTPMNFTAEVDWDTTGLELGSRHSVQARAYDIDDNSGTSESVSVVARAEHCFNGVRDSEETGIDCGEDSGSAEYCGSCAGGTCTMSEECSSGYCEGGICVALPLIEGVDPLDGAPGTLVTIAGQYFGVARGTVRFLGAAAEGDEIEAPLAACTSVWSNNQIIITVPAAAPSGPIEVVSLAGEADTTDNTRGPVVADFLVNTIARPGICEINPNQGEAGDAISISGSGFGEAEGAVTVGEVPAGRIESWAAGAVRATIPPMGEGEYPVRVSVGGVSSNGVDFQVVERGLSGKPVIAEVSPAMGPIGEYVTLRGSNFGSSVGKVTFINTSTGQSALGDFNFPEACGTDFWMADSITVKVPAAYADGGAVSAGAHEIRVTRSDAKTSDAAAFTVTTAALAPGVCRISPSAGPAGTAVVIFGERLGGSAGSVMFYNLKNAQINAWSNTEISSVVPAGAATGPVVATSSGGLPSNGINFRVENCLDEPAACDADQQCCADGTCRGADEECAVGPREASFVWRFSTGIIPITPQVIESCAAEDLPASPSPWDARSGEACVNAVPTVRFNVPMDTARFTTENIKFYKCVAGADDPCSATVDVETSKINALGDNRGFQILPASALDSSSVYEVKLATALRGDASVGNLNMEERSACGEGFAYCYSWKTRATSEPCALGQVAVTPDYKIAKSKDSIPYAAAAVSSDDICLVLNPSGYDWLWSASDILKAQIAVPDPISDWLAEVLPLTETRGEPVSISAEAEGKSGVGELVIDFTDPTVIFYEPNCTEACRNAGVRIGFNTLMDADSLMAPGNIQILECENENCRSFAGGNLVTGVSAVDMSTWEEIVVNHAVFKQKTYYRVILSDQIKSYTDTSLTGLNYGESFSWIFRTKDTPELCAIDRVEVAPVNGITRGQGERVQYSAVPYGEADECSAKGQSLDPWGYNWGWSSGDEDVGRLLAAGMIDTAPASVSAWCGKSNCLHLGSRMNIAVCGNGNVEISMGEECDDKNILVGDGCSARCLREAVETVASGGTCGNADIDDPTYISPWSNVWITGHEECDDGNNISGDGCSEGCQNEGATLAGSVCGNGDLGDGEDCDDMNRRNGDGCSSECLNEGSDSGPLAVCGNGTAERELGEDCDNGKICADMRTTCRSNLECAGIGDSQCRPRSGDGCSDKCLNEGTYPCSDPTVANCCGNGLKEQGEDCDGGESLPAGRQGCGKNCLALGSSGEYAMSSFCGDGVVGTGEEAGCESVDGDGLADPVQVAEAVGRGEVNEQGNQATEIFAATEEKTGTANFTILCGFTTDAECRAIDPELGLADNSCCYPMPRVSAVIPANSSNDQCRNAAVKIDFSQALNAASLKYDQGGTTKNRIILLKGKTQNCNAGEVNYTSVLVTRADAYLPWWRAVWQSFKNLFAGITGRFAQARAPETPDPETLNYCEGDIVDGAVELSADGKSVYYRYKGTLESDTWYQIRVLEAVESVDGVALNNYYASYFGTGTEICKLDYVYIADPEEDFFFDTKDAASLEEPHGARSFSALAVSRRAGLSPTAIQETPGQYEWEWSWASAIPDDTTTDKNIVNVTTSDAADQMVTPAGLNGEEQVSAQAKVTINNFFGKACARDSDCPRNLCVGESEIAPGRCAGETVTDSVTAMVNLCENPWLIFADPTDFHFATTYCRDSAPELLPELEVKRVESPPAGVLRDYLLVYKNSDPAAAWARDAIGLRVMPNPSHLSAEEWYRSQGFGGEPEVMEVDGYPAVRVGTSVYINAANKFGDPALFTNIYILSRNEGANEMTVGIFNQMLNNFVLNYDNVNNARVCRNEFGDFLRSEDGKIISCTSNLDCLATNPRSACDADKDKLRRDTKRITDLMSLEASFESYKAMSGGMPALASGSYLRSLSTSLWPSWKIELGGALGQVLPVDPVNKFAACGEGYDSATCFDATGLRFFCPAESLVYQYRSLGAGDYELLASLEFPNYWTPESLPAHLTLNQGCANNTFANDNLCGDSVRGPDEECELGDKKFVSCTGASSRPVSCVKEGSACRWAVSGESGYGECADSLPACGNGVREGFCMGGASDGLLCQRDTDCPGAFCFMSEACDEGSNNGKYGHCSADCAGSAAYCGDAMMAGAEQCDRGVLNGQYDSGCSWDCRVPGPMCGDDILQPEEQCEGDDHQETTDGVCRYYPEMKCTTDENCPGSSAGYYWPGTLETCTFGSHHITYGDCEYRVKQSFTSCNLPCGIDPSTGYQLKYVRTCASDACKWNSWGMSCVTDGVCGNGILEGVEQCDDGNTDNTDGCIIISGRENDTAVSCRVSRCGDGYQYAGIEACDAGSANGTACTPRYGDTCTFCTDYCGFATVTGDYCGDGIKEEGIEECDEGPIACWYPTLGTSGNYHPMEGYISCDPYAADACPNVLTSITPGGFVYGEGMAPTSGLGYDEGVCQGQNISYRHVPAIAPKAPGDYGYNAEYCDSTCHIAKRESPRCGDAIIQSIPYPPVPGTEEGEAYWGLEHPLQACVSDASCPGDQVCAQSGDSTLSLGYCYRCEDPATRSRCVKVIENEGEVCDSGVNNTPDYNDMFDRYCNASCTAYAPYCGDGNQDQADGEKCDWGIANFDGKVDAVFITTMTSYSVDVKTCDTMNNVKMICPLIDYTISGFPYYDIKKTFYLANENNSFKYILYESDVAAEIEGCIDNIIPIGGKLKDFHSVELEPYGGLSSHDLCGREWASDLGNCQADGHFTGLNETPSWARAVVDVVAGHEWRTGALRLVVVIDSNTPLNGQWTNADNDAMNALKVYFKEFPQNEKPRLYLISKREESSNCSRSTSAPSNWTRLEDSIYSYGSLISFGDSWGSGAIANYYSNETEARTVLRNVFNSIFCENNCACSAPICL
ncbi:MAG: IPT/TIG domain-containing protein [Patescibacteria group bacterium]|nr:IPT/TIG domain-containing protein [Patescibacteria group bacterium]